MNRPRPLTAAIAPAFAALLVLGVGGTASAAFSAGTASRTMSVTTATVAAPAVVTAKTTSCNSGRNQTVLVSWTASTTPRISGYRVTALDRSGTVLGTGQAGATATSTTMNVDKFSADPTSLLFSVTTLTDYGWTAPSTRTATLSC